MGSLVFRVFLTIGGLAKSRFVWPWLRGSQGVVLMRFISGSCFVGIAKEGIGSLKVADFLHCWHSKGFRCCLIIAEQIAWSPSRS